MARRWRRRLRRGVMYTVATALLSGMTFGVRAEGDKEPEGSPRVRSSIPRIAALLSEASMRSTTFRGLVSSIERTDGIVYVESGQCKHGVRACLSLVITAGGGYRILRVLVDVAADVFELMATIAHELRHALEILAEPAVRTTEQAYMFYAREAATSRDVFETRAAIQAGLAVEQELGRQKRNYDVRTKK
jgi:hypothetical protein